MICSQAPTPQHPTPDPTHTHTGTHTHYLAVIVLSAAVGGGEGGGALLQVPGFPSALGRAGDGDGVDAVGVAVARAVVAAAPAVTGRPHEDGTPALSPLRENEDHFRSVQAEKDVKNTKTVSDNGPQFWLTVSVTEVVGKMTTWLCTRLNTFSRKTEL